MEERNVGIIQMLICATLWSIAGIFIKMIHFHPLVITGFRSLFASIFIYGYIRVTKTKIQITKMTVYSAVASALTFFTFICSNKLTTAANAIVLEFTSPIFLMIYTAVLLKKKFRSIDFIAAGLTLAGIGFCFVDKMEGGYLYGNLLSIASGAALGAMYFFLGACEGEEQRISAVFLSHVIAAITGLACIIFTENVFTTQGLIYVLILGVVQQGIPAILLALSSSKCPPLACSLLGAMEPLLNPVWVAIFDGETPGVKSLIGGIMVIGTVTWWCIADGKLAKKKGGALC